MATNFRRDHLCLLCLIPLFLPLFFGHSIAVDILKAGQSINDTQVIVSAGNKFELGFFTDPKPSNFKYLGIRYKEIPDVVVWVANRDNPIVNSSATLKLNVDGNLILVNQTGSAFWTSNNPIVSVQDPVAQLLDSGNLVLRDSNSGSQDYAWQSFDYPFDTLLSGMKLGWDSKSGLNRKLISRKNPSDLSSGELSYGVNLDGLPALVVRKGNKTIFRGGPWFGDGFARARSERANFIYNASFEITYSYDSPNSEPWRAVLDPGGFVIHSEWNGVDRAWKKLYTFEGSGCNDYELCGNFGLCNSVLLANCDCLDGFEQKSAQNISDGCVRKDEKTCRAGEGFKKISDVKLPESTGNLVKIKMGIQNCEKECLNDCSCLAYGTLEIPNVGPTCVTWFDRLLDVRRARDPGTGDSLFVRVAASELESSTGKRTVLVVVGTISAMIFFALISCFIIRSIRRRGRDNGVAITEDLVHDNELEMPIAMIEAATNNFSISNKIGEGGFGPVYKGTLPTGQEIAVKKLAESSHQGQQEFKNEVLFVSQLQHRNLVKLLGFCIHREETLLIYEYMPNKSLDYFLFDDQRRSVLNWTMRKDIIIGIARGLLYLHRDSRLRIIHRDLKAANILLDGEMKPKISDFGIARMFGEDQMETKTQRVVGTYGYMSPEYAIDGCFSFKSDVYSFGVMVLEIVSGKKNKGFFHSEHQLNLLGHAWKLWNEGKALKLIDGEMGDQMQEHEALKYINIGLLCVQGRPKDRPIMSSVLSMLESDIMELIHPKQPGFYEDRFVLSDIDPLLDHKSTSTSNNVTITLLDDGR
ncbi:G-type lectin S-receptor-like serine/threonine-protein kinase At4g27290 [Cucurbita pepo subsp. pepo]|uniref:G-type lectin S-receptor-like serine/threonine-protein kinase At4g27290 n=1 Tax=Cucurbita pepo subsp. pepo TaxID=3664 RepID=UPI000C9D76A4|nr:G-type lectin S-receptor-like serine/threonine-protein kinase At4g27290 [Cucurbita pepo subsp. pepo]